MDERIVAKVLTDLRQSQGYLYRRNLVENAFREPFERFGEPPAGAVPTEGRWFR